MHISRTSLKRLGRKPTRDRKSRHKRKHPKMLDLKMFLINLRKRKRKYLKFISFVNSVGPGAGAIVGLMKAGDQKKVQEDDKVH